MKIKYLGHAGFLIESRENILLMDPWLSPNGAFLKSWYQFPRNHHLFDIINDKFSSSIKNKYIYISHDHNDHFDKHFLNSINNKDFTFIIPNYKSKIFERDIKNIESKNIIICNDFDDKIIGDISFSIFIDDSGINRDSGILLSTGGKVFLNLNDCKVYDRINDLLKYGQIDFCTAQFSGATWYPICYDFVEQDIKNKITINKKNNKFNLLIDFLENISPIAFIPSAGPPCFLSNSLININFEEPNQFPRKNEFIEKLKQKISYDLEIISMEPGYEYKDEIRKIDKDIIKHKTYKNYIKEYSTYHVPNNKNDIYDFDDIFSKLEILNKKKNNGFRKI